MTGREAMLSYAHTKHIIKEVEGMVKKSDIVREAVREGDFKKALRIAKGFRINITVSDRDAMSSAYECIVHPEFYRQIGIDIPKAIADGKEVVSRLYGA